VSFASNDRHASARPTPTTTAHRSLLSLSSNLSPKFLYPTTCPALGLHYASIEPPSTLQQGPTGTITSSFMCRRVPPAPNLLQRSMSPSGTSQPKPAVNIACIDDVEGQSLLMQERKRYRERPVVVLLANHGDATMEDGVAASRGATRSYRSRYHGGRRCYHGPSELLPGAIDIATMGHRWRYHGERRCYHGKSELLPWAIRFATTRHRMCYHARTT
jgi:hypothetical protein